MTSHPCPRSTQAGQPCRNTITAGRADCGRHVADTTCWTWGGGTGGLATAMQDPMATPASPAVIAGPVAPTGPRLDGANGPGSAALRGARRQQTAEIRRMAVPDDVTVGPARYMPARDAVVAWVAGDRDLLDRIGDGRASGPVPVTVGGIVGRVEDGRLVWRNGRTIEEGDIIESYRTFPTAQAALDDLTGTATPAITGRFGHYGPHHQTDYDDAMALLREHKGHVTSHRDPYGSADATVVDADLWRDGADLPVISMSIAYDDTGAEVRAWWANDTYASASALAELLAHRNATRQASTAA
ncbi:hypothetical protein [Euzebya pacifica]|nr:hypothetical protein [Euzebya pacifica]